MVGGCVLVVLGGVCGGWLCVGCVCWVVCVLGGCVLVVCVGWLCVLCMKACTQRGRSVEEWTLRGGIPRNGGFTTEGLLQRTSLLWFHVWMTSVFVCVGVGVVCQGLRSYIKC